MSASVRGAPGAMALCLPLVLAGCGDDAPPPPADGPAGGRSGAASDARGAGPPAPDAGLASDPWIEAIFATCDRDGYYDRDTSDLVPILVDKLEHGRGEPLKRAIEELGDLGAAAVPSLRRLLDRQLNDAARAGSIQNTLGALSQNRAPEATEQLLRALDHPHQTIRTVALRGLRDRELPAELYERMIGLARVMAATERGLAMGALQRIDPDRTALLLLDWLERGELRSLEDVALPFVVSSDAPATLARARELLDDPDPRVRAWLTALLVDAGVGDADDGDARRALADYVVDERRVVRNAALQAASALGLWREVIAIFEHDPDPTLRAAAGAALHSGLAALEEGEPGIADDAPTPEEEAAARAALRRALDDDDPGVANEALVGLVILGDEEALSRGLARLDGAASVVTTILPSLRERMDRDPGLRPRVRERLRRRIEAEENLPWPQRTASFQALSLVRSRAAAELLMEYADRAAADGAVLAGGRAHRWFAVHATNTGPEGRAYLAERLATEEDPARRLDLLFAIGGERDEFARTTLFERLDDATARPLERVYAASLLASLGPAAQVAPRLKRAALRTEDPTARRGLQCLLWYWY